MSLRDAMIASWFLPENFYRRTAGHAYPDQAEFICPQAFGRNTYSDERVGSIIGAMLESIKDPIRRFEWLKERGFNPGQPNRILAQRCVKLAKFIRPFFDETGTVKGHNITHLVIGQWEVLYAMWLIEPHWYADHQEILIPIWPPITGSWTTHAMMLTAFDIAEAHGLRVPLIVAHPEHIQRCFFIARKIFGIAATDHIDGMVLEEWFDRHSVQKQTTSPGRWLAYEMLARVHHRLHGWI
jgi:hypothetical protein